MRINPGLTSDIGHVPQPWFSDPKVPKTCFAILCLQKEINAGWELSRQLVSTRLKRCSICPQRPKMQNRWKQNTKPNELVFNHDGTKVTKVDGIIAILTVVSSAASEKRWMLDKCAWHRMENAKSTNASPSHVINVCECGVTLQPVRTKKPTSKWQPCPCQPL